MILHRFKNNTQFNHQFNILTTQFIITYLEDHKFTILKHKKKIPFSNTN